MIIKLRRSCVLLARQFIFIFLVFVFIYTLYKISHQNDGEIAKISQNIEINAEVDTDEISRLIKQYNSNLTLQNTVDFGPMKYNSLIFVVFLDRHTNNFRHFIISLSRIKGIEEAVIIFSHSYYNESIVKIIQDIDFVRVIQMYYPYSIQLHSNVFPGYSPEDCPYDMDLSIAKRLNCSGVLFPDINGHFRNPQLVENKHHFWWTANNIFDIYWNELKKPSLVIFINEYVVFTKDFIYWTLYMKNVANTLPKCEFLTFGGKSLPVNSSQHLLYGTELIDWNPNDHAHVLAFDISTWNNIVGHYDLFCSFDDHSWLRSLYHISLNKKYGYQFKTLSSMTPRIFKMKSCGSDDCEAIQIFGPITELENKEKKNWYPPFLELHLTITSDDFEAARFRSLDGQGGFADPRDNALCQNMTVNKIKKILLDMNNGLNIL